MHISGAEVVKVRMRPRFLDNRRNLQHANDHDMKDSIDTNILEKIEAYWGPDCSTIHLYALTSHCDHFT